MMQEAIQNLPKQFEVELEIAYREEWKPYERFCVVGMGGSALAADLLKTLKPSLDILVHKDYGLPVLKRDQWVDRAVIASSYSGNTEEALSAFQEAQTKGLPLGVISVGGKLLELAKKHDVPYVEIPDTGIQPRSALGFMLMGLLKLVGEEELHEKAQVLSRQLHPEEFKEAGKTLANRLQGKIPVIYSSLLNAPVAYNWKIKLNESAKIPAFTNVFPELNHNEMNGFDVIENTRMLSERFAFIFLKDASDSQKIKKRMDVLQKLYEARGLRVELLELQGYSPLYKIFSSLLLADWTAYFTAHEYGTEPEQVPLVEEFKKLIA